MTDNTLFLKVFASMPSQVVALHNISSHPSSFDEIPSGAKAVGYFQEVADHAIAVFLSGGGLLLQVDQDQWPLDSPDVTLGHHREGGDCRFWIRSGSTELFSMRYQEFRRQTLREFEMWAILIEYSQDDYEWIDLLAWATSLSHDQRWQQELIERFAKGI